MEERQMTIARGLTRLKTIKAQINANNQVIRKSTTSSKRKSDLADMREDINVNHSKAKAVVESALQSNKALATEFVNIKLAIAKANLENQVMVAGRTMSLAEAMLLRREIKDIYGAVVSSYSQSLSNTNSEVQRYNDGVMANSNMSAEDKKVMMAETVSFLSFDTMNELNAFITVFMQEVDGTLNEVNALTVINV